MDLLEIEKRKLRDGEEKAKREREKENRGKFTSGGHQRLDRKGGRVGQGLAHPAPTLGLWTGRMIPASPLVDRVHCPA